LRERNVFENTIQPPLLVFFPPSVTTGVVRFAGGGEKMEMVEFEDKVKDIVYIEYNKVNVPLKSNG